MNAPLASYLKPGDVLFYSQVGNVGVYWPTHRAAAKARFAKHLAEHDCGTEGKSIVDCPAANALWDAQHPDDRILVGIAPAFCKVCDG